MIVGDNRTASTEKYLEKLSRKASVLSTLEQNSFNPNNICNIISNSQSDMREIQNHVVGTKQDNYFVGTMDTYTQLLK